MAPGRYTWTAYTVKSLIDCRTSETPSIGRETIGGPDWIDKDRFDVVVQAEKGAALTDPDGFPGPVFAMVRAVLAERFGLVTHNEVRERPVYALTAARADRRLGAGLKRPRTLTAPRPCAGWWHPSRGRGHRGPPPCSFGGGPGRIQGNVVTLAMLANMLARNRRTAGDRSHRRAGYFDVTLEYAPEARHHRTAAARRAATSPRRAATRRRSSRRCRSSSG